MPGLLLVLAGGRAVLLGALLDTAFGNVGEANIDARKVLVNFQLGLIHQLHRL